MLIDRASVLKRNERWRGCKSPFCFEHGNSNSRRVKQYLLLLFGSFSCLLNRCVLVFCTAYLTLCKRAQCLMERERVDVDVGRCQRHTGAYRTISASVQVSQFSVSDRFLEDFQTFGFYIEGTSSNTSSVISCLLFSLYYLHKTGYYPFHFAFASTDLFLRFVILFISPSFKTCNICKTLFSSLFRSLLILETSYSLVIRSGEYVLCLQH